MISMHHSFNQTTQRIQEQTIELCLWKEYLLGISPLLNRRFRFPLILHELVYSDLCTVFWQLSKELFEIRLSPMAGLWLYLRVVLDQLTFRNLAEGNRRVIANFLFPFKHVSRWVNKWMDGLTRKDMWRIFLYYYYKQNYKSIVLFLF